jgi:hypothetical protein
LVMAVGSALTITLAYVDWELLTIDPTLAFEYVRAWSISKICVAAAVSWLVPFFCRWHADVMGHERHETASYSVGVIWILLFWLYPGPEKLGRWSDPSGFIVFTGIWLFHSTGISLVNRVIRDQRSAAEPT